LFSTTSRVRFAILCFFSRGEVGWRDFGGGRGGRTEGKEELESAVVLAVVAGFGASDLVEGAGGVGNVAVGECCAGGGIFGDDLGAVGGLLADFPGEGGSFHAPGTHLAPAAGGHGVEKHAFDLGLGLEFAVEACDEFS
jgi:hypothetical protein